MTQQNKTPSQKIIEQIIKLRERATVQTRSNDEFEGTPIPHYIFIPEDELSLQERELLIEQIIDSVTLTPQEKKEMIKQLNSFSDG